MNTLSTCLSLIGIVGDRCADRATNNHPLAYEILECCPIDLAAPSPDICASPNSSNFGARVSGDVSSEPIGSRMKLTYCSSVRQRERNYFRQLKILKSDIKVREQQLTTCLLTPSSRCQSQSAPCVLSQEKNYHALILWDDMVASSLKEASASKRERARVLARKGKILSSSLVVPLGLEPRTPWLWVRCSNQLSYRTICQTS